MAHAHHAQREPWHEGGAGAPRIAVHHHALHAADGSRGGRISHGQEAGTIAGCFRKRVVLVHRPSELGDSEGDGHEQRDE